ncbi:PREDICTED: 5-hydroxytryptamine receptor 1A-alpha-like [Priapulus caudatus]|uniref:5-hydroxytryptamine receptor 1A-alpha-like n=1 Tax=Priapulus caudatus TaxID=37621 RepID=A0ABM1EGX5_PRICU|nr:PREDICTED: 5-hydroxytryptamine receptor 1A-alpha-like [Priapulus caudatus]
MCKKCGEFACALWITFDYFATTASIFTMLAISMDRLWSVTWSVHYRNNNTTRKTIAIISVVWLLDVILILPAIIVDRVREHPKWSDPTLPGFRYDCIWDPARNVAFVYSVMFVCYQVPLVLMIVCYFRVYYVLRKRAKIRRAALVDRVASLASSAYLHNAASATSSNNRVNNEQNVPMERMCADHPRASLNVPGASASARQNVASTTSTAPVEVTRGNSRRTFTTLTYILASFVFCWEIFLVMFAMKAIDLSSISYTTYVLLFWLPYFNSTLNPVLYGISSSEFRKAFRMILHCK